MSTGSGIALGCGCAAVVGALVIVVGGVGAWYALRSPSAAPTPLEVSTTEAAPPPAAPSPLVTGQAAYALGQFSEALVAFDEAVANGGGAEARAWRARTLLRLEDYPRALDDYEVILEDAPGDPDALYGAAWVLYRLDRVEDSLRHLDRLLLVAPDRPDAIQLRGDCFWRAGKRALALADAERACTLGYSPGCVAAERYRSVGL